MSIYIAIYFIFFIVLLIIYVLNSAFISSFKNGTEKIANFNTIARKITSYRDNLAGNNVNVIKSKVFYYDSRTNTINIEDKDTYKLYDLFVYSHEIGHSIEFYRHRIIYNLYQFLNILSFVLYLLLIIVDVIIIVNTIVVPKVIMATNIITIFLFVVKLMLIYWIENCASLHALTIFKILGYQENGYRRIIHLSIINQYIYCLLQLLPLLIIVMFLLF